MKFGLNDPLTMLRGIWASLTGQGTAGAIKMPIAGLNIPPHDYIEVAYYATTNNIETVTYKTGGSAGTTVATLTLTYVDNSTSDSDLVSVTKS